MMPQTGTRNDHYDLISVAYHALQGAVTAEQYLRDAQHAGDREEQEFFNSLQRQYTATADRAKELLATRLSRVLVP